MRRRRAWWIAGAVSVAVVAALSVILWRFAAEGIRTALIDPMLREFGVLRRYVERLPEITVWVVVVSICLLVVARALSPVLGLTRRRHGRRRRRDDPTELERVVRSFSRLHRVSARRHVSREIGQLASLLLARDHGLSLDAARQRALENMGPLPERIGRVVDEERSSLRGASSREIEAAFREAMEALEGWAEGGTRG